MRILAVAVTLLVSFSWGASAASKQTSAAPKSGKVRTEQARLDDVERKSEQALREQQARDAKFDAQVRRATSSICAGCLDAQPVRQAQTSRRHASERASED